MGDLTCRRCGSNNVDKIFPSSLPGIPVIVCNNCSLSTAIIEEKRIMPKYIVIRDDNPNRTYESCEQATLVAEKLVKENPSHRYHVAKLIKESKLANVVTIDLE